MYLTIIALCAPDNAEGGNVYQVTEKDLELYLKTLDQDQFDLNTFESVMHYFLIHNIFG